MGRPQFVTSFLKNFSELKSAAFKTYMFVLEPFLTPSYKKILYLQGALHCVGLSTSGDPVSEEEPIVAL